MYAYTLDMPGQDQEFVRTQRDPLLSAVTKGLKAAGYNDPMEKGSRIDLLDTKIRGRNKFNAFVRDNPKIRPEDYRRYLAALYDGGILVQRVVVGEDGLGHPADEEPLLLPAGSSYGEWTKIERLVRAPIAVVQTNQPKAAVVASATTAPPVVTTASASTGNGAQK